MTIEDHLFPYRVSANRYVAHCHVRLVRRGADALLLISELASNPGMSICNAFEDLLPQLTFAFDLLPCLDRAGPEHLTVIEHWGPFSYGDQERAEEFTRVTYTYDPDQPARIGFHLPELTRGAFSDPVWTPITRADVEGLLGSELPPFPFQGRPEHYGLRPTQEVGR